MNAETRQTLGDQLAGRVVTLIDLERYREAVAESARAIATEPDEPRHFFNLARAQIGLEQPHEADQAARQAVALAPEWPAAHYLLSITRHGLKDFNGELQAAERAAQLDPEDPDWLDRLARAQLQSGMLRQARVTADQVIKLAPEAADTHSLLADINLQLDDYQSAETHVRAALKQSPESAILHNDLGTAMGGQKQWAAAVDAYLAAARIEPDDLHIRQNLEHAANELAGVIPFGSRQGKRWDQVPAAVQSYLNAQHQRRGWAERYRGELMMGLALGVLMLMTLFFSQIV